MILQSICFCFVPLMLIFAAFYAFVPNLKITDALLSVLAGLLAIIPAGALNIFVFSGIAEQAKTLSQVFTRDLILNGLAEEVIKMIFIYIFISRKLELKTFFFCALLSGAAVGCFELFIYFYSYQGDIQFKYFLRLFTAVLLHTFCAGLGGLTAYSIKNKCRTLAPVILAVILHGTYNYFAGFKPDVPFFYFSFAVILFSLIECRVRYTRFNGNPSEHKEI